MVIACGSCLAAAIDGEVLFLVVCVCNFLCWQNYVKRETAIVMNVSE